MRAWLGGLCVMLSVAGCSSKPCATSNECGNGEVCANERCQALGCEQTFAAIDPADGLCKPIGACLVDDTTRSWASCQDPCVGLDEFACVKDARCQPVYAGPANPGNGGIACAPGSFAAGSNGLCNPVSQNTYLSCRANPVDAVPCAKLDEAACKADARCVLESFATPGTCGCVAGQDCNCGPAGGPTVECRPKTCLDYSPFECLAHPECSTQPVPVTGCNCPPSSDCFCGGATGGASPPANADGGVPFPQPTFDGGTVGPTGCYPRFFGCNGMDEATCLAHPECHPVGAPCYCPPGASCACGGGGFLYCEPDDGLARCNADSDCDADQRCNNDEQCAPPNGGFGGGGPGQPVGFGTANSGSTSGATGTKSLPSDPSSCPGLCVPKGCAGYGEKKCNADPSCEAVYELECSPYGGGGFDVCGGGATGGAPVSCGGGCDPTFVQCKDGGVVNGVVPERSVLVRDPVVVDDPAFSFANVMTALAAGQDANAFVTQWLAQITVDTSANGRLASARLGARDFLASLPHLPNGNLDVANLGFQTTSLSNRLDLAGPHDCGEARITFAHSTGVTDRRHRMTVIVELRQPDDGANCRTVASQWLALSSQSGATLTAALKLIYAPLLAPATLDQVRTNEFLVGPQTAAPNDPTQAWQLREWRLGTDGALHLAASKQAIDPTVVNDSGFQSWLDLNADAIRRGVATVPDPYLAITSSEDGSRIFLPTDPTGELSQAVNKAACAGCHTTESNTAFVHVAERFGGTGQALISKFLEEQLPSRALHLWSVAHGGLTSSFRNLAHPVH